MKTEKLRELGLTQEQIDFVMAENGRDINSAKGNLETVNQQIDDLKNQLQDRDTQLNELKKSAKDNEALTQQINELQESNKNSATEYANKLAALEKHHAIENAIRDAKAKNVKAVMALLDAEKITLSDGKLEGLSEQLETLKTGEDTGFLFSETQTPKPAGAIPSDPPIDGGKPQQAVGLNAAIAKALTNNTK